MVPLLPARVVFTGTQPGSGLARRPPRFLQPGRAARSRIEGIGEMRQHLSQCGRRAAVAATGLPSNDSGPPHSPRRPRRATA